MHLRLLPLSCRLAAVLPFLSLLHVASAQELGIELVASGFESPLWVGSPPGDFDRLFVVEQDSGLIKIIENYQVLTTPFLDVGALAGEGGEQGLLGMAFHPNYANNGRFFVNYTNNNGDTRVVEYAVSSDPNIADPTPVQTILAQSQPYANHNGGNLAFGSDGMLYIGLGDGGSGGDPDNRAQDGMDNLGKMLRLDVDVPPPFIPSDNPFLGDPGVNDEIWALGLRNPWRYSFDRSTGDLFIADVGQGNIEEIDFQPRSSTGGENYGWRCMEGTDCTGWSGCSCTDPTLVLPIHEYGHGAGNCSVIGGFVYRGDAIRWFQGTYVFGDYCTGRVWSFRYLNGHISDFVDRTSELEPPGAVAIENITSFGEDAAGELYIIDPSGGEIFRIMPQCSISSYCTANANSSGAPAVIGSSGSSHLSTNDLVLRASSCPPNQFGIFFYGAKKVDVPFGNGHLCVAGGGEGVFRLNPPLHITGAGTVTRVVDYGSPPMVSGPGRIEAGATWNFQFWFRDPAGGGAAFDTSDALSILFCP
jgi:glucose/arabinose dehydrogenase